MRFCRSRAILLGAVAIVGSTIAVAWSQDWFSPPLSPPAGDSEFVAVDTHIPVRPDSEGPYEPYKYQLTTDQTIRVFEGRVQEDPNHLNLIQLGGLYIRKAKEVGDHTAYVKAEATFRRAIKISPKHRDARVGLAIASCGRHKFAEGEQIALGVYKDDPSALDALVVVADARLELGNYTGAEEAIRKLEQTCANPPPPAIQARVARLAELKGDPSRAVLLLRQATETAQSGQESKESKAWYPMRLGEVLLTQGKLDEAAAQLGESLKGHPDSPAALALLGRVRAAQGQHAEAIALCEKAVRRTPDVATLVFLGDLRIRAHEEALAKLFHDTVEEADREPVGSRDLVLYYCDHNRKLSRALELAEAEAKARKDVYTCDALAWALFKNGKLQEAERMATESLRLGTKDALLLYHAGVIAHAAGHIEKARDYLRQSLAINPYFSEPFAREAAQLLKSAS